MGIDHSTHAPGHGSASISHKFDIRERKFGKRWHVYDYTTNSTVFESVRKGACVKWIENHQDLFQLAASHEWGMKRVCSHCKQNLPLSRFRLNGISVNSRWRKKCGKCEWLTHKSRADRMARKKASLSWWAQTFYLSV